jgi:RNA polymerase sigma factor (sigma-70 family)
MRRAGLVGDHRQPSDPQLLNSFLRGNDQEAFTILVRRHGPMVLGVCRRVLRGNLHDAEDAFQATFIVFARKAGSLKRPERLANWLYGVAYRTALQARCRAARRGARERQVSDVPHPVFEPEPGWQELWTVLDQELSRLPEKYRLALVLCDLEQRTRGEVTRQLCIPAGTLSSRLAAGRKMLAARLTRRGLAYSAGTLALAFSRDAAPACVPAPLVISTVKAGVTVAAGGAGVGLIPVQVAALTREVIRTMLLTKLKLAALFVLAVGVVVGVSVPAYPTLKAAWLEEHDASAVASDAVPTPAQSADDAPADARPRRPKAKPAKPADAPDDKHVVGSGNIVTKEIDVTGFTSVDVRSGFNVEIINGKKFRTAVTVDDNIFPYVAADKDGSKLSIGLESHNKSLEPTKLKVEITMPSLEEVRASHGTQMVMRGFKSAKDFKAHVFHGSSLEGDFEAGKLLVLEVGHGSSANLKGLAKEAKILVSQGAHLSLDGLHAEKLGLDVAHGSSVKLKGSAKEAKIAGGQGSTLSLGALQVGRADVHLTHGCHAVLAVSEKLDYTVSMGSQLDYKGKPTLGRQQESWGSSVGRLKSNSDDEE